MVLRKEGSFGGGIDEHGSGLEKLKRLSVKQRLEMPADQLFELVPDSWKTTGRFYHGSPKNVDLLKASSETGEIRPGEEERRGFRDVLFLTTDIEEAIRYAGPQGVVYHVDAEAVRYKPLAELLLNPKKASTVHDDIFVATPEHIHQVVKWVKVTRNRRESQKYETELAPHLRDE